MKTKTAKKAPEKYDTTSATGCCCLDPMGSTEIKIKPPADVPLLTAAGNHRSEEVFHTLEQTLFDMVCPLTARELQNINGQCAAITTPECISCQNASLLPSSVGWQRQGSGSGVI